MAFLRCRWLAALLAALAMIAPAVRGPGAAAQSFIALDENVGEVSGWRVGYGSGLAGCVAFTTYTDDNTVWIGYGAELEFFIAFSNPAWRSLEKGATYNLVVRPRGGRGWNGNFLALDNGTEKGLVLSGLKKEFLIDFAEASAMTVHTAGRQITQVSLSGSRNALTAMLACQKDRLDRARSDARSDGSRKGKSGGPSSGTGFFVSDSGHVLTNNHVVESCRSLDVSYAGGAPEKATLLATDAKNDLALILTNLRPRAVPAFRPRVRVGESIYVFGFPLVGTLASSGNFTTGTITAIAGFRDDTSTLQISAPVQPGNSGGPLVDKRGNIVGVIVSRLKSEVAQNANFAIKASIAETFLDVNGVRPPVGERSTDMDAADIADQARTFTVHVVCNRPS